MGGKTDFRLGIKDTHCPFYQIVDEYCLGKIQLRRKLLPVIGRKRS
jgi:hypothetical protein